MPGLVAALGTRGAPTRRTRGRWEYGRNRSLKVHIAGARRGSWFNHEFQCGGGPIQLIRHEFGIDFAEAIDWARRFLGIEQFTSEQREAWERKAGERAAQREAMEAQLAAEGARDRGESIAIARRYHRQCVPPDATLGERYLTLIRRIPKPTSGWPASVLYHAGERALVFVATDAAGNVMAVQLVRLDVNGNKLNDCTKLTKQTFGRPDVPVAVRFPAMAGADVKLQKSEGPETGLSAWAATRRETWVTLGSLKKGPIPSRGRFVIGLVDDDPFSAPSRKGLSEAIRKWRKAGCTVVKATPFATRRQDKSDFNNLLKERDLEAVRERIEFCINPPKPTRRTVPADVARSELRDAVARFFAAGSAWGEASKKKNLQELDQTSPPPVHAVRVTLGAGKSSEARKQVAKKLRQMRERGDARTVVFAVPTHTLGDEQARAFEKLPDAKAAGLTAEV
jgi:putative DNA primase/helicase